MLKAVIGEIRKMSRKLSCGPAERNKQPILEVLLKHFDETKTGNVLEVASGTGTHIVYFAERFPKLTFQPSEFDRHLMSSITAYAKDCPTKNVKLPLNIDVCKPCDKWGLDCRKYDYMININMIHITPYECARALFDGASALLPKDGLLVTYGPYKNNGVITPESNVNFDKSLRMQNPEWGLKDIRDLRMLGKSYRLEIEKIYNLPANNNCIVWKKMTD